MCEHCSHLTWQEYLEEIQNDYKEEYEDVLKQAVTLCNLRENEESNNEEAKGRICFGFDSISFAFGLHKGQCLLHHFEQEHIYEPDNIKYLLELIERTKTVHKRSLAIVKELEKAIADAEAKVLN
jgi:hypothetical protein